MSDEQKNQIKEAESGGASGSAEPPEDDGTAALKLLGVLVGTLIGFLVLFLALEKC